MQTVTHCLECNAQLSPAEAQGLCARCLLKMGLASQFGETSVGGAGTRKFVPPPMFPFDFGEYRVLRLLGRGGMGAVYEAEQRETGRRVALKVLGHTINSPEMQKRFLREGRLAASVNHPNSVYIFGTEEIDGAPVIAMELVAGGTLRDQVKSGPLAAREAVDAILHVIAGLEAAANAGVLHRDVKPANCFVAPDGTVKVGDFGLSVSTLARHDSQLTASGTMLGTPSFAPPEQLRGDELDMRADIYSVGATLYSLLTGRAPFEGDNAVNVVAAVLDKPPKPIAEIRQNVPAGLVQVVGKCLAKKREERFVNYSELRDALRPFSSQAREPAPVGMRTVAGIVDFLLASILIAAIDGALFGKSVDSIAERFVSTRTLATTIEFLGSLLFFLAYFAIPEGLWGASPGKLFLGLRVLGTGRGAPGIRIATVRALIVVGAIYLADFLQLAFTPAEQVKQALEDYGWTFGDLAGPLLLFSLFVTMRRRNGFAGIHELLTGTRVVVRQKSSARPRLEAVAAPAPAPDENAERLGPFRIVAPIAGAWFNGFDDVLRRSVWIRKCDANTAPPPAVRRDLGRAGRLRWIAGARGENESWDAFDAPAGKPLCKLSAHPWASVRCWLLDLAEELDAASKDGTLPPEIGIDHVFIAADGRALLLDEPWPGAESATHFACADIAGAQHFLDAVASASLDRTRLPLHARDFLKKLGDAAFDRASFIAGNLRSLLAKPAAITRLRRLVSITLMPALVLLLVGVSGAFMVLDGRQEQAKWAGRPEMRKLDFAISQYKEAQGGPILPSKLMKSMYEESSEQMAKYISGRFGEFINSPAFDSDPVFGKWSREDRDAVRKIVLSHQTVNAGELELITASVEGSYEGKTEARGKALGEGRTLLMAVLPGCLAFSLIVMCISQLVSLLFIGRTPGQGIFGFAVVNKRGEPAGRARMLFRWLVIWVPLAALTALVQLAIFVPKLMGIGLFVFLGATAALCLACLVVAIVNPEQGTHDKIARTRLVPR